MTVRFRTATSGDAELLAMLGARLFAQTFGPENTPDDMASYLADAFSVARQTAELAEPDRLVWIVEDASGTAIGYAVLMRGARIASVEGKQPAELRRIYVDSSFQGRPAEGSGKRVAELLLDRCIEGARAWDADVIWLAVWERNARALRFYEKHGFQAVGKKTFQLGADLQHDFVMARNL
jgi:ribosomal protein S18 acetylase RimI-like enzyme